MSEKDELDHMVTRFLQWPLPASVCADLCATDYGKEGRCGTNLLNAEEAKDMLKYVLRGRAFAYGMLKMEADGLRKRAEALQAKIDALMLEYCPDEMTPEQIANWEAHQRPVEDNHAS